MFRGVGGFEAKLYFLCFQQFFHLTHMFFLLKSQFGSWLYKNSCFGFKYIFFLIDILFVLLFWSFLRVNAENPIKIKCNPKS